MGCGGSRLDQGTLLPPQLRSLFLIRLDEFRKRRTLKDSLLLQDDEEGRKPKEDLMKMVEEQSDALTDHEDERMIGHGASPSSPSFRVYFEDDHDREEEHLGQIKKSALKCIACSDDDIVASKECCDEKKKKKVRRERKMKNLRKVFSKGGQGGVRNLLAVKSSSLPSRSAHHRHLRKTKAS